MDFTKDIETQFRPLQLIEEYHPQYIDPEYGKDPYWYDERYNQENLQFRHDDYPPTGDEDDPKFRGYKLSKALIELSQPNSEANNPEKNRRISKTRSAPDYKQPLRREGFFSRSNHKGGRTSIHPPLNKPWSYN